MENNETHSSVFIKAGMSNMHIFTFLHIELMGFTHLFAYGYHLNLIMSKLKIICISICDSESVKRSLNVMCNFYKFPFMYTKND